MPRTKLRIGIGLAATILVTVGWVSATTMHGQLGDGTLTVLGTGAGIVASVLLHEGAHALAVRSLGYRVEWVLLGLVTGTTSYSGSDDRPLDHAAIAMAGPAVSAMAVLALLALWTVGGADRTGTIFTLLMVNGLTVVVNLAPLPGSDGWQVGAYLVKHWGRPATRGAVPPGGHEATESGSDPVT